MTYAARTCHDRSADHSDLPPIQQQVGAAGEASLPCLACFGGFLPTKMDAGEAPATQD